MLLKVEDQKETNKRNYNFLYDMQIILLKKGDEGIELYKVSELECIRDLYMSLFLDPGTYYVVPRSTGCHLEIPPSDNNIVPYFLRKGKMHPFYKFAFEEIFRKYDSNMDGLLSLGIS